MAKATKSEITALLRQLEGGDRSAEERLIEAVYPQLKRIAARQMKSERPDHTLQPTALANEAYIKLAHHKDAGWQNRAHFFAVAARVMRRILLDYARSHRAQKRGGQLPQVPLSEVYAFTPARCEEVIILDEALQKLSQKDEDASNVVELRFFGGLSVAETAEVLQTSERTVKRKWKLARAWLHARLRSEHEDVNRQVGES